MLSYSTTKQMKSLKVRIALLSMGMLAGLAYEAFATDSNKPGIDPKAAQTAEPGSADAKAATPIAAAAKPEASVHPKSIEAKAPAAEETKAPASTGVKATKLDAVKKGHADKADQTKRRISIESHTAEIVNVPSDVADIFVADQEIADVVQNVVGVAYVYGKKPGNTTIFGQTKEGKAALMLDVQVTYNIGPLKRAIAASFPNERVNIVSTPTGIILEGDVGDPIVSRDIVNIAQRYIGDKDTIINSLGIKNSTQVMVSVKVVEVNRSVLHNFNINLAITDKIGDFAFGILTGRQPYTTVVGGAGDDGVAGFLRQNPPTDFGSIGGRLTSKHYPNLGINGIIDAMGKEGLTSILAEPNLVVLSGETAKVLLGGEFPYPVPQGNNSITVQFKQFGVQLDVTPTILSGNLINLHLRPEVSALDYTNAVDLSLGAGVAKVPALKTRRSETTVELASGSSLAIAGLLSNQMQNTLSQYPGLSELPVLGALFRSPNFQRSETELVIIVTPYLVSPVRDHDLATPMDNLQFSSFLGMILSGRLNNPRATPEKPMTGWTDYLAAGGDETQVSDVNFETNLADKAGSGLPTNDQSSGSNALLFNRPEYLGQGSGASLAGSAGFYTE